MNASAALDLSPGAGIVLNDVEWLVERQEPHLGRVHLVRADGDRQRVSFRFLVNDPHCRPSSRTAAEGADRGRQPATWSDVKPEKRPLMEQRFAHLMEVRSASAAVIRSALNRVSRVPSTTRTARP